ncbi:hypothetical protein [Deinococcus sedimenti]|uniref:hypothetical protein n=1 Tax=Deinococcus sedimenti TaxID=1867090 RepID=UPI00166BB924|nr:hypothetical protein [Deinococcus sedimenti]
MTPLRGVLLVLLALSSCARDVAGSQTQAGALRNGAGLLTWAAAEPGPRDLEPSTREALTDSLLRGEREIAFARLSGQPEGLRDLFSEGALDDARAVAAGGGALATWGHRVTLRFYAPDGGTVSLTDRFTYLAVDARGAPLRTAVRVEDRVLQLDDGNWRTHHWRTVSDQPLPEPTPPGPAPLARAVRFGPDDLPWRDRSDDQWRRDLQAVRDLGLDTLVLPLDLRPGQPERADVAATLARLDRLARRAQVAVHLTVRTDEWSPRALRALHGALGPSGGPGSLRAVTLRAARLPDRETTAVWRQTLQARGAPLALGSWTATPGVDFIRTAEQVFRARRWPLGLLHAPRQTWQLRAFVQARPAGGFEVGALYGPGGLLTADGSFTPLARALTRPGGPPGAGAFVWGWTLDLWPALLAALVGWAARPVWRRVRR